MIALAAGCLASALGCSSRRAGPARETAKNESSQEKTVTVAVSTEPRHRPTLKLGPGLLGATRPRPQPEGTLRLTAQRCQVEGATFLSTRKNPAFRALELVRPHLYAIDHTGAVLRFNVVPGAKCRLRVDKSWGTGGVYRAGFGLERLSADDRGTLVASGVLGSVVVRRGRVVYRCKAQKQGHIALHPTGGWGLAGYWGSDVQHLVFGPASCTGKGWHLTGLKDDARRRGPFRLVSALGFRGDTILVGGSLAMPVQGWHPQVVVAFDNQGRRRFALGALTGHGVERFGWIHAVGVCGANRICVVDSNNRLLTLWDKSGKFMGAAALPALLGLRDPWVTNLAVITQDRAYLAAGPGGSQTGLSAGSIFRVDGLAKARP